MPLLFDGKGAVDVGHDEDERGGAHDEQPVGCCERLHAEHAARHLHDEHLAQQDDRHDEHEAPTERLAQRTEAAQGRREVEQQAAPRLEVLGIEEIPKLYHHEEGEEDAQLVGADVHPLRLPP